MIVPVRRQVEGFVVAGVAARTCNADETDPARAKLPALWGRFAADPAVRSLGGPPVGVYTEYESDAAGMYTTVAGVRVAGAADAPSGLRVVTVPAGEYLVFRSEGAVPECVIRGWQAVWQYFAEHPSPGRAFRTDAELYGDGFVELLISCAGPDRGGNS
ncbi:MAG TPA: GyrI-like domain-containing protein [Gemmataceae bacterium]|jgi:predicted transcriptional regulator YdeE